MYKLNNSEINYLLEIGNKETCEFILKLIKNKNIVKSKIKKYTISNNNIITKHAEKQRKNLIKNQTKYEIKLKAYLKSINIEYIFQKIFYIKKNKINNINLKYLNKIYLISDFYLPEYNIVIEVDGYYHKKIKKQDNIRDKYLEKLGIKTLRIWNNEILNYNKCTKNILTFINKNKQGRTLPMSI